MIRKCVLFLDFPRVIDWIRSVIGGLAFYDACIAYCIYCFFNASTM